jgi:hypothetical protein
MTLLTSLGGPSPAELTPTTTSSYDAPGINPPTVASNNATDVTFTRVDTAHVASPTVRARST